MTIFKPIQMLHCKFWAHFGRSGKCWFLKDWLVWLNPRYCTFQNYQQILICKKNPEIPEIFHDRLQSFQIPNCDNDLSGLAHLHTIGIIACNHLISNANSFHSDPILIVLQSLQYVFVKFPTRGSSINSNSSMQWFNRWWLLTCL